MKGKEIMKKYILILCLLLLAACADQNEIKDNTPPRITILSSILIKEKEDLDVEKYFIIEDESSFSYTIEPLDTAIAGKGKLEIEAVDEYSNSSKAYLDYEVIPESSLLDVDYYNQYEVGAPLGCEGVCLYMALSYKNTMEITINEFLDTIPVSNISPYEGFMGSIYGPREEGKLPAIYPEALVKWGNQYGRTIDLSDSDLITIEQYLSEDSPVLVWITTRFEDPVMKTYDFGEVVENTHTVLLIGYDNDYIYYHDPISDAFQKIEIDRFMEIYQIMSFGAAVI